VKLYTGIELTDLRKMKWLYVFVAILVTVSAQENYCSNDIVGNCGGFSETLDNCNANYSGFSASIQHLQAYANEQLIKSFDYLLLSANFGTYVKNRPGFEKQFRGLSDTAWNHAIDLIKHITKRGGQHDFYKRRSTTIAVPQKQTLELSEINALALALDTEKSLATEAQGLHERYSHANHKSRYDAEVAHYLEEKFIEDQATTIRKLSGYTNDLRKLMEESVDSSLALFMFDEYLHKQ